jgi:O-antigen ligase
MAIGFPILLYCATGARQLIARAVAAGCLPLLALCAFLTASRGGVIEIAVGLVVFIALAPDRLSKLGVVLAAGAGSALLVEAGNQRAAIRLGLRNALAAHQGSELIAISLATFAGVALIVAALVLIERYVGRPRLLAISARQATRLAGASTLLALIVFAAAGGIGFLQRKWDQFKSPGDIATSSANAFTRLQSTAGEGRYQYWQVAAHAAAQKPLTGTGANTFQFLWLQHGTPAGGFVVDAHSLYIQALGELGYPGLLLIVAFIASILGCGVWRVVRSRDPARRHALAAATAGAFAFAIAAAFDWVWFIPVLPFALFVCAAVIFAPERDGEANAPPARAGASRKLLALRAGAVIVSLAAIIVIALPMAATEQIRDSQAASTAGDLERALAHAKEAVALQPYAAAGWLQEALVQEEAGDLRIALTDAQQARKHQSVNWQIWLVLSRLEARNGNAAASLADYRHMRWLNPNNLASDG